MNYERKEEEEKFDDA